MFIKPNTFVFVNSQVTNTLRTHHPSLGHLLREQTIVAPERFLERHHNLQFVIYAVFFLFQCYSKNDQVTRLAAAFKLVFVISETPASATEKIFFMDNAVHERSPAEIRIQWVKQNLTTNDNAVVQISLWGYRETTIHPEFVYIDSLATGITNTGEFTISPASYRSRDNRAVSDVRFGFIQVNLTESIPVEGSTGGSVSITPKIWSRPIPLGWYFGPQWEGMYGTNWPQRMCDNWLMNDRYNNNIIYKRIQ